MADPLFAPSTAPRVFATPLGVDFCADLIAGLDARLGGQPPEALARVQIWVPNDRMQRRLQALYLQRGPGLLPRIRPVLALAEAMPMKALPPALSPLDLRLRLAQLIAHLLDQDADIAPRSALYALADSLADFMGEMAEEGVGTADLLALDMGAQSQHWDRARAFLGIAADLIATEARPTPEARQTAVIARLTQAWDAAPPRAPVLIAGSTGSRAGTFALMQAVARLPQGAVILPGLDRDMPDAVWTGLLADRRGGLAGEDHPQFRLARLLDSLDLPPGAVPDWGPTRPANPARNRLVSLALRPAPVTDQWRAEGPQLTGIETALADVTLLEAPSPQVEATAIALRLRATAEAGGQAALVTPDRTLSRRVTAQLDRWGLVPDDSGGQVLALTPPGRFLRQVADSFARATTAESLVADPEAPVVPRGRGSGAPCALDQCAGIAAASAAATACRSPRP